MHWSIMGKLTLSFPIQPFSHNMFLTLSHWRNFYHNYSWFYGNKVSHVSLLLTGTCVCIRHTCLYEEEHSVFKLLPPPHKEALVNRPVSVSLPMALRKLTCGCLSCIRVLEQMLSVHVWQYCLFTVEKKHDKQAPASALSRQTNCSIICRKSWH